MCHGTSCSVFIFSYTTAKLNWSVSHHALHGQKYTDTRLPHLYGVLPQTVTTKFEAFWGRPIYEHDRAQLYWINVFVCCSITVFPSLDLTGPNLFQHDNAPVHQAKLHDHHAHIWFFPPKNVATKDISIKLCAYNFVATVWWSGVHVLLAK